jgi:Lipid A 3-O-deacylase (PagL)
MRTFLRTMKSAIAAGLIFIASIWWSSALCGQASYFNDFYIRAAYHPGYVMPEYSLYPYLVNDYARAWTLSVSKRTPGKNYWAQLYNYPEFGLAVQYSTLGNSAIFGHEWSLYPFFNVHIFEKGKFSFINQTGMGIGWVNKKFDPETNPYNVAVGTTLNVHFNFELNLQYLALKKFYVFTGIAFDHLSNGNLGEPNLGINSMTFNAGMRYRVGKQSEQQRFDIEKYVPSTRMSVFYPGIGVDLFYDSATKDETSVFGEGAYSPIDDFKTGFHFTQELVYNKFSLALQEGFYVFLTDKAFGHSSYHRFIIRHQVSDRFFLQLSMKAHVVVLDYLELGAGYHIKP